MDNKAILKALDDAAVIQKVANEKESTRDDGEENSEDEILSEDNDSEEEEGDTGRGEDEEMEDREEDEAMDDDDEAEDDTDEDMEEDHNDDAEEEKQSREAYISALKRIVDVVRSGKASFDQKVISAQQWQDILNKADDLISQNCYTQYDEDIVTCVGLFAAPEDPTNHNESRMRTAGMSRRHMLMFIDLFIKYDLVEGGESRIPSIVEEFSPPAWSTTARPSPSTSLLARCSPEYDFETLSNVPRSAPSADPVLTASFKFRVNSVGRPWALACTEDYVLVSSATGYKEREAAVSRYKITAGEHGLDRQKGVKPGFGGPFSDLVAHRNTFWGGGDQRIKAFSADTGKLLHTLDSEGFDDAFGVTDDMVFRGSKTGAFAKWERPQLIEHEPAWSHDRNTEPLGGRLHGDVFGWLDDSMPAEVSLGQSPSTTFSVPHINGPLKHLVRIPNTTRWLCSFSEERGPDKSRVPRSFGIRSFDIAQPDSGANVAGLGIGSAVADLVVHKDIPDLFVVAGDDRFVRIFDARLPLPQMILESHQRDVNACAIAPFGGQFPIIFSGGGDEMVKAWDIRHTKGCLCDMSAGTLTIVGMAWHDERNTLYVVGENAQEDRFGQHFDYEEEDDEDDSQVRWWPKNAFTNPDYFGKRWCAMHHSVLEYDFRRNIVANVIPAPDELDLAPNA